MKSSQPIHDSIADEQAALWAARLDGDTLDAAQRTELDAWLAQKPHHRVLLSRYCQFSADLEEQIPALVSAGAVVMPASGAPRRRWWTLPRISSIAFAAAAAVALMILLLRPMPQLETVAMASGQRGERTLADGTRVELNANTSLRFENTQDERRVRLVGGEALFIVAKDPSRPFFVQTPAGSVRVTGTTFNVRTEPNTTAFEVTVIEGSVQVSPADSNGLHSTTVALGPHDQFSTRIGGTRILTDKQLEEVLAWRHGRIVFEDTPLSEAAARFARYHGRAIRVAPAVANESLGGVYGIDDLSGFLAGLEQVLPRVKTHTDYQSGAVSIDLRPGK
jgi:transmembrane sensor